MLLIVRDSIVGRALWLGQLGERLTGLYDQILAPDREKRKGTRRNSTEVVVLGLPTRVGAGGIAFQESTQQ
jgi:hypothetical protein